MINKRTIRDLPVEVTTQESEESVLAVLEDIASPLIILDKTWCILFVNTAAEKLVRKDRKDLLGQELWQAVPDSIGSTFFHHYCKAMNENTVVQFESMSPSLDAWLEIHASPSQNGLLLNFRDITAKKQAENEQRRLREELPRTFIETLPVGIFVTDRKGMVITSNGVADKLLERVLKQPIYTGSDEFIISLPDNSGVKLQNLPVQAALTEGKTISIAELILHDKDGNVLNILVSVVPLLNEDKNITGAVAIFQDFTKYKLVNAQMYQLASLVSSSGDAIVGKTLDGMITSWNTSAEELYGYTAEEVVGKSIAIIVPAEKRDELTLILARLKQGESISRLETTRVKKDGTLLDVAITLSPIKDMSGTIIGASTITHNITAQKQAERALRQSETYKAAVLQTALDAVISIDYQGLVLDFNPAAEKMFGYSQQEVLGRELVGLIIPQAYRDQHQLSVDRFLATSKSQFLDRRVELTALRADGSEFPIDLTVTHIPFTKPPVFTGFVRDITERKRAEEELQASEQNFRSLADTMPQMVWTARADGAVEYYNSRWLDYTGMTTQEIVGWGWSHVVHPKDVHTCLDRWKYSIGTGAPFEIECRIRGGLDDAYRWHLTRALPVRDENGTITKWFGTSTDVDEQKRIEEALRSSEASLKQTIASNDALHEQEQRKDHFISMASHELKTPITSLKMFTQALHKVLEKEANPSSLPYVLKMEAQIERLTRLVGTLLDVTKMQQGKLFYEDSLFDLDVLVQEVIEQVQQAHPSYSIQRTGSVNQLIFGDKDRLEQVVTNLLANAVKYSARESRIDVQLAVEQSTALVQVKDYGIGIPQDSLKSVFERFYRVNNDKDSTFPGLGIGLYIASEIVERHGGRIWVESTEGKGSTFRFSLPLLREAGKQREAQATQGKELP